MNTVPELQQWVAEQLSVSVTALDWQPLPGDASFRRYFRCQVNDHRYIVALAPPETEKNHEFVHIAQMLERAEVAAPHVIGADYERGYLLQNDLGTVLLSDRLSDETVDSLYHKAMLQLQQMLDISPQQLETLPPYDADALALELSYFNEWFLGAMLDYSCSADEQEMLQRFYQVLINSAEAQPQIFVHRDYHCRNIMITDIGELATIDFQDALHGPLTYDLVSLLRDCYVVWPEQQVAGWVRDYWQLLHERGITDVDSETFKNWFDLMGLQRHIKVLGIFARLSIRDGKHGYLNDLPTVVDYVRRVAAQCDEAVEFSAWFEQKVLPLAKAQPWGATL